MHLDGGAYGNKRILSAKAVAAMHTPPEDAVNPRTGGAYGLGFYLARPDKTGKPQTFHHGGALGTMGWVDADRELVGVFFSQAGLAQARPVIQQVQQKVRALVPAATTPE